MQQQLILSPIDLNDLESLILKTVRTALAELAPPPPPTKEFINLDEASELLRLKTGTIYGLIHRKQIPYYKKRGRLYFKYSELISWLTDSRRMTGEEVKQATVESLKRG